MGINDLIDKAEVIALGSSADHMKAAIQKRLEFVEKHYGVKPGSLIQVTDSAYQAVANLTQSSIGLALEVIKMVMPSAEQLDQNHPYVITDDHVKKLGFTYESLCEYWDNPLRRAKVIHAKHWLEQ